MFEQFRSNTKSETWGMPCKNLIVKTYYYSQRIRDASDSTESSFASYGIPEIKFNPVMSEIKITKSTSRGRQSWKHKPAANAAVGLEIQQTKK